MSPRSAPSQATQRLVSFCVTGGPNAAEFAAQLHGCRTEASHLLSRTDSSTEQQQAETKAPAKQPVAEDPTLKCRTLLNHCSTSSASVSQRLQGCVQAGE